MGGEGRGEGKEKRGGEKNFFFLFKNYHGVKRTKIANGQKSKSLF